MPTRNRWGGRCGRPALIKTRPRANRRRPGPPREHPGCVNAVITGAEYDIVNVKLAQKRLHHLQAQLRADAEQGDMVAVDHDIHKIDNVNYRIAIHEWLILWNLRQYPCFYPIRTDEVSCAAIAQATHPIPSPYPRQYVPGRGTMPVAPKITITIINAEQAGDSVAFSINGITHRAPPARARTWPWLPARTSPMTLVDRSATAGTGSRRVSMSSDRLARAGPLQACGQALNKHAVR